MQTHIIHSLLKRALGLLCLCVWPLCGLAQQLTVQAPRSVAAGQTFQVTFSIDASHQKFQAPSFQGLTVLGGPSRSQSSSTTFINGKRTTSSSYSYSFYVRAEQEGTVTIGPASCVVEGKTISSEPATLTVTKTRAVAAAPAHGNRRATPRSRLRLSTNIPSLHVLPSTRARCIRASKSS